MHSLVKQVMYLVGVLTATLLLFNLIFGDTGQRIMWENMKPAFERSWKMYTLNDGAVIDYTLTERINESNINDLTTP